MHKPNQTKLVLTVSGLVLCLGLSLIANRGTLGVAKGQQELSSSSRGPASSIFTILRSGTLSIERKLAVKVAQIRTRGIASIGRPAELIESLKFGLLEGKYSVVMNGETISEIKFIDIPDSEGRPAEVKDRVDFLKRYGKLLNANHEPEKVSVKVKGATIIETYRIRTDEAGQDTVVSFVVDNLDRLLEMHAEKVSALNIF